MNETASFVAVGVTWLNSNQGVVSVTLFFSTLVIGWFSGIFDNLRNKPKLTIYTIPGPSFVCTFGTGAEHNGYDVHRTGIALYLQIANVGSAPTSIMSIEIGYRWAVRPLTRAWWMYGIRRFWIREQSVILEDFQVKIGDKIKIYPFLTQGSSIFGISNDAYLSVGKSINGIIYFEQAESWGGCFPKSRHNSSNIRVRIIDVFGRKYSKCFFIPRVSLDEACAFNPSFGLTFSTLNNTAPPIDLPVDMHGNIVPTKA